MQYISSPFKFKPPNFKKFDIFNQGRFISDRKNPENVSKWPYKFTIRDDCLMPTKITNLGFEEVCLDRLRQLKQMNKTNWVILWSGGIDSSLVLRLFLEHHNDFSFSVMLSDASIQTFPEMYRELLQRNINLIPITKYFELVNKVTYLNGGAADPLTFQHHNFMENFKPNITIDEFYSVYKWFLKSKNLARFHIEMILSSCPYKLEYFCDLAWWYSFNFRWQGVHISHSINFQDQNRYFKKAVELFYTGELFQRWSLSTYQDRRIDDLRDIKSPLKKYLYALGDKEYAKRISKTRSHTLAIGMHHTFKSRNIDADGKLL